MKVSKLLAITGVVAVLAITNVAATAFAQYGEPQEGQQFGPQGQFMPQGRFMQMQKMRQNVDPGVREQVRQAVENGDYNAWQELIGQHERAQKMFENVNADNFYLLNELHQAKENRDMERAKEIAEQLGLKRPMKNFGQHVKQFRKGKGIMKKVGEFVESGDFQGWYDMLTQGNRTPKILEYVNADNFNLLQGLHEARQNGDTDKMEEIRNELGLPLPPGRQ
jgi:hypothetical protein